MEKCHGAKGGGDGDGGGDGNGGGEVNDEEMDDDC